MPRKTSKSRRGGRRMKGKGFIDFIKKVGSWFKSNKIISTVGNALGAAGVPYASKIGSVAGSIGLGRKRGGALRLAGAGGRLAGGRRRIVRRR